MGLQPSEGARDFLPYNFVTLESLTGGPDTILSHARFGGRGIIFARLRDGEFGVVTVAFARDGSITKVLHVNRMLPSDVSTLGKAFEDARDAFRRRPST
jgi:hypothetical protein